MQVGGHPSGAAAEIGDRAAAVLAHEVDEGRERGAVEGLGRELVAEELGVVDGDDVVGRPRGAQVQRLGHRCCSTAATARRGTAPA